ncbi:hypothetical protein [Mycobacterium sp. 050134]|uniref:hypothetical protein n=1 Tax=Mycobacterium sp. 050134 TaxID=3096111 RepID=UPI002EDA3415
MRGHTRPGPGPQPEPTGRPARGAGKAWSGRLVDTLGGSSPTATLSAKPTARKAAMSVSGMSDLDAAFVTDRTPYRGTLF